MGVGAPDRRRVTLWRYVRKRNGVRAGAPGSMSNMLRRSFGASTLAGFWRHWNPIWGYELSRFVNQPLNRVLPLSLALVLTFVVSGLIHDAVIMALRGEPAFIFTTWFFFLALGVVADEAFRWNFGGRPWMVRAGLMLAYLGVSLWLSILLRRAPGIW